MPQPQSFVPCSCLNLKYDFFCIFHNCIYFLYQQNWKIFIKRVVASKEWEQQYSSYRGYMYEYIFYNVYYVLCVVVDLWEGRKFLLIFHVFLFELFFFHLSFKSVTVVVVVGWFWLVMLVVVITEKNDIVPEYFFILLFSRKLSFFLIISN